MVEMWTFIVIMLKYYVADVFGHGPMLVRAGFCNKPRTQSPGHAERRVQKRSSKITCN